MLQILAILLAVIMVLSSFQLINAETQIPFWVDERLKWWAYDKLSSSDLDVALSWLADKNQIPLANTEQQKIPPWLKTDTIQWSNGKISNKVFFDKIYAALRDGSIQVSAKSNFNKKPFKEYEYSNSSPLFRTFAYKKDFIMDNGRPTPRDLQFEMRANQTENYKKISSSGKNSVVILPIFTSTAYYEPGFYTYYRGECDTKCVTKKIEYGKPYGFSASSNAIKVLRSLGYKEITDIDVDKNPTILSKYKKVIVLHNEYVTQKEFDAITKHPHVLYLYPNALYAEVSVDYQNDTITLVRGHGYPSKEIGNGFDWKFDNSKFEYDHLCSNWKFTEIPNGKMLNCYPQNIIFSDYNLLKSIKDY